MIARPADGAPRSRWIPWAFVGFFGVVFAVNAVMVTVAFQSWPGLDTTSAYQRGLAYNRMLRAAEEQADLDWQVVWQTEQTAPDTLVVDVDLADQNGNFMETAEVAAWFRRPTHGGVDRQVPIPHLHGQRYRAEVQLPLSGRWQVHLTVTAGGERYQVAREVFLTP